MLYYAILHHIRLLLIYGHSFHQALPGSDFRLRAQTAVASRTPFVDMYPCCYTLGSEQS